MTNALELVREFHETYNCAIRDVPTIDTPETLLRIALIAEEVQELRDAVLDDDTVEIFDAILDIVWVTYGALLTFGLHEHIDSDLEIAQVPQRKMLTVLALEEEVTNLTLALTVDHRLDNTYSSLRSILELCYGAILTYNLPFEQGIEEVARSNRSKLGLDGKPIYRETDGKVLKGPNYSPPDLERIIHAAQITTGSSR